MHKIETNKRTECM